MKFRLWDINNQQYCKSYDEIVDKVAITTSSENSNYAVFQVNAPELVVEFDTDCLDKSNDPIFCNDIVGYQDQECRVVFDDGIFVLYDSVGDKVVAILSRVAAICKITGTVHDNEKGVEK